MSRLPHFLDNRLTNGGEVVSLTSWPPFTSKKIPGTHFCRILSRPQGHSAAGRIRSIEKSNDFVGNRNHGLPAHSIVPQRTTLPRASVAVYSLYLTTWRSIFFEKLSHATGREIHYFYGTRIFVTMFPISAIWIQSIAFTSCLYMPIIVSSSHLRLCQQKESYPLGFQLKDNIYFSFPLSAPITFPFLWFKYSLESSGVQAATFQQLPPLKFYTFYCSVYSCCYATITRRNMRCLVTAGKHINNTRIIARQMLGERIPASADTHATV
jgi:hypothetical protein